LRNFEGKVAFIYREESYTYNWLLEIIEKYCFFIKEFNYSVYSINSDYSPQSVSMLLALYQSGKCIVPICESNEDEVNLRLNTASVELKVSFNLHEANFEVLNRNLKLPELVGRVLKRDDSAIVLFSSGTTGRPKAMVHNLDRLASIYESKKPRKITFLIILMFDHIGGLNTLFNALSMGATIVIPERREPGHVCYLVEKYRVNVLPTSPTFLNLMLISEAYKRYDLSSLKMITYGTEPMPEELLRRLRREFPRVRFLQTFGTSETGIATTSSKSSESLFFKIDDPSTEWKVVNGELWLRSQSQILGYLNYDNPFTEDGWFPTGDLVEITEDGYIKIIGRTKEIINVGGEKVLPQEVENVILELPEIVDVVVYGESNPITGQIVVSKVVPQNKRGIDEKTLALKVRKHCRNRMKSYKVPVKVHIVDTLDYGERFKKKRL
jgi:acyl-coenzyme A synthetase/AMP-(fatty) acid ligase